MPRQKADALEEQRIQGGIAQDPDNPEWTDADFALTRPGSVTLPALVAAARRHRGPQRTPTKAVVSLRLDRDLVDELRGSGPGWQSRANDLLRKAILGE